MVELVETTIDSAVISTLRPGSGTTGSMTVLSVKLKPLKVEVASRQEYKADFLFA